MAYRPGVLLQFGMITAIVDIDNAVQSKDGLKTVCLGPTGTEHVPTAIRQHIKCPECANEDTGTFKKASVLGDQFIVVEKEEVATAKASTVGASKKLIALQAHPASEVHTQTIQGGGVYQLHAAKGMEAVVSLLTDTLQRHPELAFTGLWSPAGRQNFYEVKAFGDTLVMEERARTEQLKIVPSTLEVINPAFQAQIDALLTVGVVPYDPATYVDTYDKMLDDILATKTAVDGVVGRLTKSTAAPVAGSVDLSAMLLGGLAAAGLKVAQ